MNFPYAQGDKILAAEYNEVVKSSGLYAADGGASDAYVITVSPVPTSYIAGMVFRFKANTVNTGEATLNVNGLGAKTIKKNLNIDLATGDIVAGQLVEVMYDGTNFQMISSSQPRPLFGTGQTSRLGSSGTGTQTIAHGLGVTPRLVKIFAEVNNFNNNGSLAFSQGTATSSTDDSCTYWNHASQFGQTSEIIALPNANSGEWVTAGLSALDSTNITLNFTSLQIPSGTSCRIQWEAYA
jgi:hypothetical protein